MFYPHVTEVIIILSGNFGYYIGLAVETDDGDNDDVLGFI